MNVILNDRPTEVPDGATVASLLESLSLAQRRVAVELDGEIVPRTEYGLRSLSDGVRVEVVQFVGGG